MLGDNIKKLRQYRQYSQEKLAEKLGISRQALAKWEKGETFPDLPNFVQLAEIFEVTLDDLANYTENEFGFGVPPKGKHMFGAVPIDEKGCIALPQEALSVFNLQIGDELLVLGDEETGIALVKKEEFIRNMQDLLNTAQEP